MAATLISNSDSNYSRELIAALLLAKKFGLTDGVIAAITSTGTKAKLRAKIVALSTSDSDANHIRHILSVFDKCSKVGCFTDANVETARAAGNLASLLTSIASNSDGVSASATGTEFQF